MQTAESLTDASTGEMEDEMGTGATAPYEPPASAILVSFFDLGLGFRCPLYMGFVVYGR